MTGSPGAEYLVADLDDWAAGHLTYIGTKYRVRWLDMLLLQMSAAMWASLTRGSRPATRPQRGMTRPGVSCQWPVGLPCGRSRDLLVDGHVMSLLVAS